MIIVFCFYCITVRKPACFFMFELNSLACPANCTCYFETISNICEQKLINDDDDEVHLLKCFEFIFVCFARCFALPYYVEIKFFNVENLDSLEARHYNNSADRSQSPHVTKIFMHRIPVADKNINRGKINKKKFKLK